MEQYLMSSRDYDLYLDENRIYIYHDNRVTDTDDYYLDLENFDDLVDFKTLTILHNKIINAIENFIVTY